MARARTGTLAFPAVVVSVLVALMLYIFATSEVTWRPLVLSLQVAALATVLTLVFGIALALLLQWERLPGRDLVDALVSAPLVLPPTVLGYYLLVMLGNSSAVGGMWERLFGRTIVFNFEGAVIAAAVGSMPLVVRSIRIGLDSIDPTLGQAARTLGANPMRVLFTIVLPLAAPGIVAGLMLGFARALGDYGATLMVAGAKIDGTPTASIFIMDQLLAGHDDRVFAMSAITTLLGVTLLFSANVLTRRFHYHRAG
jgi:molybdate transport system permease protein